MIREKAPIVVEFFRGQVDKYTWRDIGSSYLLSDLQAAYLWAQLEQADKINERRLAFWQNLLRCINAVSRTRFVNIACCTRRFRA